MTSLREDEIYCYVSPRGSPRTWTGGKTKKEVKENVSKLEWRDWKRWEKNGFRIKKFRLIEV